MAPYPITAAFGITLAQEVLSDLRGDEEKIITIEQIQRSVAEFFGVKVSDFKAKNRTRIRAKAPKDTRDFRLTS
jgi:chromosomal replication initiation ATPase DnaA